MLYKLLYLTELGKTNKIFRTQMRLVCSAPKYM